MKPEFIEALIYTYQRLEECLYCSEMILGAVKDAYGPDREATVNVDIIINSSSKGLDRIKDVLIEYFLSLAPDPRNPIIKGELASLYDILPFELWVDIKASAIAIAKNRNLIKPGPGENSKYSWKKENPLNVD